MQTQKVFRAGNSNVVAIPADLSQELGIKAGESVIVQKSPVGKAILISKPQTEKSSKTKISAEFKKWLKEALEEDKEILDELAIR